MPGAHGTPQLPPGAGGLCEHIYPEPKSDDLWPRAHCECPGLGEGLGGTLAPWWGVGGETGVGGDRGEGTEPGLMSAKGQEGQSKWIQQSLARPLFQNIVL